MSRANVKIVCLPNLDADGPSWMVRLGCNPRIVTATGQNKGHPNVI